MSCSNRHTAKLDGVWRLGQACTVGVMTNTDGEVTWHTKCLACGVYSDPVPASIASKWGKPSFDVSMTSRTLLGFDEELMAEGWYTVKISKIEEVKVKKEGKNHGKPMYKTTFMVTEGNFAGRTLDKWICLFDGAWFMYKDICKAIGIEFDEDNVAEPKELIGNTLRASVKWEPAFRGDDLVAAIDRVASVSADPVNQGKIRIAI